MLSAKVKSSSVVWQYVFAAFLSLVMFAFITHAWHMHLSMPYIYSWDGIFTSAMVKSVLDTGWYITNPYIGAPDGFNLGDYPINADNFHFLIIKLLTFVTHHYAVIWNLYFILTFPLITVSALFVMKRLGLSYPFALAASLLFALQPYHFFRGAEGHLFLTGYYMVPLAVWLAAMIAAGKLADGGAKSRYLQWGMYFLICVLMGSTGVYYALFGVFFMLTAGVLAVFKYRKFQPLLQAVILSAVVAATLAANLVPSMLYRHEYGVNTEVAARTPFESELYGLKIVQMLLPIDNDRVPAMAHLKNKYNTSALFVTHENNYTTLGVVAGLGFIFLLAVIIFGLKVAEEVDIIAKLNLCGLLLATMGGFGTLISYAVSPMIRCYARISIFIAFFSLYAFFYFLQKFMQGKFQHHHLRASAAVIGVVIVLGVVSQTGLNFSGLQRAAIAATFNNDRNFVHAIEKVLPAGSKIYQLPYVAFPESSPVVNMTDYEHFRPYLHSRHLQWSYGAMRGRPVAEWQAATSVMPVKEALKEISYAGFDGLYIDRNGYEDHGAALEKQMAALTHVKPIISNDGNLAFYDLREYVRHLQKSESPSQWQKHVAALSLHANISIGWVNGFYQLETDKVNMWRWSNNQAALNIINYDTKPVTLQINFTALSGDPAFSTLILKSSTINASLKVNQAGTAFSDLVVVPPGVHTLTFTSNAQQVAAPADARHLFFRIQNFKWKVQAAA